MEKEMLRSHCRFLIFVAEAPVRVSTIFVPYCYFFLLQKFPNNVGDLGKLFVAKGFKKLPKVQKIAQSGHTECH